MIRGSSRIVVQTLRYVGDHPGLPQDRLECHTILKKNDLYIQIAHDSFISLFPFVTVQFCPHCKTRETFFIDRWDGEKARLKSFERGHTLDNSEIGNALSDWQVQS